MGIHNRDYFREEPPGGTTVHRTPSFGSGGESASKWIIIACVVAFVLQHLTGQVSRGQVHGGLTDLFVLHLDGLKDFQLWRILTYGLLHANLMHLIFNMIGVWVFGRMTDSVYGARETLAFFAVAVGISGLAEVVFAAAGVSVSVVGASGGVMGLVALAALNFPRMPMYLMFIPVPIELRWLAIGYIGLDLFQFAGGGGGQIANLAHLAGAATGIVYFLSGLRILPGSARGYGRRSGFSFGKLFGGGKSGRSGPSRSSKKQRDSNVRLYEPPADDVKAEVDRILDKINREGRQSLTPEENEVLLKASESYRNRV